MTRTAMVIPLGKAALSQHEQVSWSHLARYPADCDRYLLHPIGLTPAFDTAAASSANPT